MDLFGLFFSKRILKFASQYVNVYFKGERERSGIIQWQVKSQEKAWLENSTVVFPHSLSLKLLDLLWRLQISTPFHSRSPRPHRSQSRRVPSPASWMWRPPCLMSWWSEGERTHRVINQRPLTSTAYFTNEWEIHEKGTMVLTRGQDCRVFEVTVNTTSFVSRC